MRQAKIFVDDILAGLLSENEEGYLFQYEEIYLESMVKKPVSLTLPLQKEPFKAEFLFPFFDGLIPEGWLLNIAQKNWKLDPRDRMGLLMATCKDCIGNISVTPL
ncbi:HipA N-terminal domain-containing protein [Gillisia marina]|uniref:HipA N-terminal domain-containing protein n=1 Tax=Gillisia marina TaxID=1167637 RepID=UPI000299E398|nr:HipA N-terminal domain-containing protein [Gillisia marina]